MNFKKTILLAISLTFTFATISRPIATSNEIEKGENNIKTLVKKAIEVQCRRR